MQLRKTLIATSVALLAVATFGLPAGADVLVNAGTLDFDPTGAPAIGDFTPVTLNGTPQLTSLAFAPFTIIDATGSGAGWNVRLTVPNFVGADTILATNVSMSAPVVIAGNPGSSMVGVTPLAVPSFDGSNGGGNDIVSASVGNGLGIYLVSPAILKLVVPQSTLTGLHVSLATISVQVAP
jgi:hypothetical protein